MDTLGEKTKTSELLDVAARVTTVGTYGSAVVDRLGFDSSLCVQHSAASSAGSSVTLNTKMQESDAVARGSKDDADGAADNNYQLRDASTSNIKFSAKVTQSGARQIKSVFLKLKKEGTITSGKIVTCRLETDSTGDPSGTLVHADATKDVETDDIAAAYGFIEFELTRPVDIADTTVFHIVLTGDYTESTSNCITLAVSDVASGGDFNFFDAAWDTMSTVLKSVGYIEQYTFSDISGAAFAAVSETAGAFEKLDVELVGKKRYVRALATVAGTSASFQCGASVVLGNAADKPVSG